MTSSLSPEAQEAAASVYLRGGMSLDQIEKDHPQLKAGVKRLRKAEKPARRGSGPIEPMSSRRKGGMGI